MTVKASFMFAKSLIFPKTEKKSSARRSLFGALLCIGISLVPLIVVMTVTNGMIDGMTERLIGLSSSNLQAYIASNTKYTSTYEGFVNYSKEINQMDNVISVYPEVGITGLAAGKNYRTGAQIRAVVPQIFEENESFKKLINVVEGDITAFSKLGSEDSKEKIAVIGKKLAETLELHPGDNFRIITTRTVAGKISPKLTSFKVAAIVSSGYQELDALWVFVPLKDAYSYLSLNNANYTFMIETPDAFSPELVGIQNAIQKKMGRFANVYRWNQVHNAEFENFSSTRVMLIFVMVLIVLVASINISSAIVMLVMERRKEIAILKSIGASPSGITLSFLLTGLACGCGGILIGLPIGLLCAINANQIVAVTEKLVNFVVMIFNAIKGVPLNSVATVHLMDPAYYLAEIPVSIPFNQVFLIVVLTLLLSLIVSIVPAIKAGKEKPLEILRKA